MTLEALEVAGEHGAHTREMSFGAETQAGRDEIRHVHADGDGDAVGHF